MKTRIITGIILAALIAASPARVCAEATVVHIEATELATYEASESGFGDYFVLSVDLPTGIKTVRYAYLELHVDVASRVSLAAATNDTPLFEAYALKSSFAGTLSSSQLMATSRPTLRAVAVGDDKRVVIDITEIVQAFLADPSANFGIILGSLTGGRDGVFSIRNDAFDGKGVARITLIN